MPARTPNPSRRDLHEADVDAARAGNGLHVIADAALDQPLPELTSRQRAVDEKLADGGRELSEIGAAHPPPEGAVVAAFDDELHERPQQERVADRDQVHRPAHQRETHRLPFGQHPPQLVRVEALQARPQAVVGRHGRLRLKSQEMLDVLAHRDVDAAQKQLALEYRAVELALPEDLVGCTDVHHRNAAGRRTQAGVSYVASAPAGASSISCVGGATGRSRRAPSTPAAAKMAPTRKAAW
jgi:hypothetical protein